MEGALRWRRRAGHGPDHSGRMYTRDRIGIKNSLYTHSRHHWFIRSTPVAHVSLCRLTPLARLHSPYAAPFSHDRDRHISPSLEYLLLT